MNAFPRFVTAEAYAAAFADADRWASTFRAVVADAGLGTVGSIDPVSSGTFPVAVCPTTGAGRVVVKVFAPDAPGVAYASAAELDAYRCFAGHDLPVPDLVAAGEVAPSGADDRWPYLVLSELPGTPWSGVELAPAAERRLAAQLGEAVAQIHAVDLGPGGTVLRDHVLLLAMLEDNRATAAATQLARGHLPPARCHELDAWLPPVSELVDPSIPARLVHADLHRDHVFVDPATAELTGIIDFADAVSGAVAYELAALHAGSFGCDRRLLDAFADGYGGTDPLDDRRLFALALLHGYDVLAGVAGPLALDQVPSLDEAAARFAGSLAPR